MPLYLKIFMGFNALLGLVWLGLVSVFIHYL